MHVGGADSWSMSAPLCAALVAKPNAITDDLLICRVEARNDPPLGFSWPITAKANGLSFSICILRVRSLRGDF